MDTPKTPEQFEDLVARDVRATELRSDLTDDEKKWLRSPEIIDDWHDTLVKLLRSVDLQFTAKRMEINSKRAELSDKNQTVNIRANDRDKTLLFSGTWTEYLTYVGQWRIRTSRFKGAIEERIAEAKKLRRCAAVPREMVSVHTIEKITGAIQRHHDLVTVEDDEVDDVAADEELWAILEDPEVNELTRILGAA